MRFSCKELGEVQAISLPIVSRLIACSRLAENDALKLKLALQEAVLNAVEHGNLELESSWKEEVMSDGSDKFSHIRRHRMADPSYADRLVVVTSTFDGETIKIIVKDEGKGFLHAQKPAVAVGDNLSCFGRGLTLISNAVDEVRYEDGGSQVTLIKRL
jgi:anti-sigma regulatory factor (Ser/Thr protein kinase)